MSLHPGPQKEHRVDLSRTHTWSKTTQPSTAYNGQAAVNTQPQEHENNAMAVATEVGLGFLFPHSITAVGADF